VAETFPLQHEFFTWEDFCFLMEGFPMRNFAVDESAVYLPDARYASRGVFLDRRVHGLLGERGLLAAILYRSFLDLSTIDVTRENDKREARSWFLSCLTYSGRGFTFLQVCEELEINPKRLLAHLMTLGLL